jgi:hypothetical protein
VLRTDSGKCRQRVRFEEWVFRVLSHG